MVAPELAVNTDRPSSRPARSHSISSDRPSLTGYGSLLSPPTSISPDPAFIAASAASQIVTNDHDSLAETWFDQHGIEPSGETALVAPPALKLVNRFLDQLLFNFLSVSRSTSLASLRPAVGEVLKPKLAKDAISGADQELNEYLGGGEDEELMALHDGLEQASDWDLELVWKRTRLRCMVYSSLGDMEEEDEDFYTEQEHLDGPAGSTNRFSNNPGVVSPAVAIFLTSILEFMGEQVLIVAGQAAYHRLRAKHEKEERDGTDMLADIAERVVVEESDMERVALDRTLGRLWRGWKKRIRSPTTSVSMTRSFSRESLFSQTQPSRAASVVPEDLVEDGRGISLAAVLAEYEHAASIPLPLNDDDIREIEIPGLAQQSDDEEDEKEGEDDDFCPPPRPKSLLDFNHRAQDPLAEQFSQLAASTLLPAVLRKRSNSLPAPAPAPYKSPITQPLQSSEDSEETDVQTKEVDPAKEIEPLEKSISEPPLPKAEPYEENDMDVGIEKEKEKDTHPDSLARLGAGVLSGAAAISSIAAVTNGEGSHSPSVTDDIDVEEEFNEEPLILTSSRVSIGGGRISPDEGKRTSRRSSSQSPSIHSLRLIDVVPPKSPAQSRAGLVDTADYASSGRVQSPLQTDSQSPRVSSPVSRVQSSSPITRNGSSLSSRHPRNSIEGPISEVEEMVVDESESNLPTAVPADPVAAMQSVDLYAQPSRQFTQDLPTQQSGFVLSAPPTARNTRDVLQTSSNDRVSQPNAIPGGSFRSHGIENGVPPLTPLREMMEGAPDTSDEASSVAPSADARSISENGINSHSPPVSASTMPSTPRATDQQKSTRVSPINTRSSPPRSSREEAARKGVPEPISKSQRAIHTSGSGSSSSSHKLKPVRTSEDTGRSNTEDKGQSFEQLIRSDQTIQYTLTPQNMRNIESPDSPRYITPAGLSNGSDGQRSPISRPHSSSVSRLTGLNSNPPVETPKSNRSAKVSQSVSRSTSSTGTRLRSNAPQPRDARVDRDSIGDFAEFIRSTGPAGSYEQIPSRSTPNHRGVNGTTRNGSGSSYPRVGTASSTPRRTESSAGRSRLQARDAVVTRGDSISDLIDFVRSGPQLDKENHRIPRTVAPFRTTMDSDQMSGAIGGRAIDASLPDPRYSQTSTSVHSSVTSQSALLNNMSKPKQVPVQTRNNFDNEDMMPKRKTRRVLDPYAIDLSDEDEDGDEDYQTTPKVNPVKEESLADFLRNVPPPPELTTTSVFESVPRPTSKNLKKKSSTQGLMSRFGRNGSSPQLPPKSKADGQGFQPLSPKPLYTPIAAKYSTTLTSQSPVSGGNYVSQLDTARNKVAQKTYQPREAVYTSSRTNDLAEFLRRSEPPSSMQVEPQTFTPTLQKDEGGTFQRMFGRKKVH